MKKVLFFVMFICAASQNYKACSPYLAPLVSHTITSTTIDFQVISTSQWQCCFVFEMELICDQANFTGTANLQPGLIVCKGSGNGSSSSWGSEPYPVYSFSLADLCPGVPYKYRVRERHTGYNYWSDWSSIGNFTIDGAAPTFELTLAADPPLVCAPDCSTLTATYSDGCSPPILSWTQGLPNGNQHVVCPTENTVYQVTANFNVPFCPNVIQTQSVSVNADLPAVAGVLTASPPVLCEGETTTISIAGQYGALQWQSSEDPTGPFIDISGATSNSYTFEGALVGEIYFRVRVYTCSEVFTDAILIQAYDYPQVSFTALDVCYTEPVVFENTTQNEFPITAWDWDFDNGNTSTMESPIQNFMPGTYQVSLTATNAAGCSNTQINSLNVYDAPFVDFTANPLEGFESLNVDFINNSSGAADYIWDFGDGNVTFSNSTELSHTFQNYGVYTVILSASENGCTDSATLTIVVIINEITYQIPNVFTPNLGDDINADFQLIEPLGFNRIEEFEINILNRWGQVIRTYMNYDFSWNGKDESGNDLPEGVYFYKMYLRSVQDDIFENHGYVHLIRE